jgi:hypothetical protein
MVLNDSNSTLCQGHGWVDQYVDTDPSSSQLKTNPCIEKSNISIEGLESESTESLSKGDDIPPTEDLDLKTRKLQLLQLMENFSEVGADIVASVFDSCQNDIEETVTKLSEMTESMGIERYYVFDEGA